MEDEILEIIKKQQYAATWGIAAQLKIKTSKCLKLVKLLEAHGLVKRSKAYGNINNIVWELEALKVGE